MTKSKEVPFQFSNELKDGVFVLTLSGVIRKRYSVDDMCIDANTIRNTLDPVTNDIVIKLNSPGGDVFEGMEIRNYLKDHPSNITIEVTGLVASAATFLLTGANKTVVNLGTSGMVHEGETFSWGNKTDLKKNLDALETIDENILDIYAEKTGQPREVINKWVNEAKWFTANQMVEYGFADEVKKDNATTNDTGIDIGALVAEEVNNVMANMQITNNGNQKSKDLPKQKSLINKLRRGEKK